MTKSLLPDRGMLISPNTQLLLKRIAKLCKVFNKLCRICLL